MSTSPVEVLRPEGEGDVRGAGVVVQVAAVDGKVQLRVEVAGAVVGQEDQLVPDPQRRATG